MKKVRERATSAKEVDKRRGASKKNDRLVQQPTQVRLKFVVGIGASAGGLEAITALISHLPADPGLSLVVIQHLSPTYRSMMVQLLARATKMRVREAFAGEQPEINCIHVAPANKNLVLIKDCFELLDPGGQIQPKPSVNAFFISLARCYGNNAIGLILSGTGSDGAEGIRAVHAAGGTTIVQDPNSARYDGMPNSAIDTGCVHRIMTPEKIAEVLLHVVKLQDTSTVHEPGDVPSAFKRALALLRKRTGVDFSGYKESTLHRRLERRMLVCNTPDIESYTTWLEQHPDEIDRLYQDILISVTAFFRDLDAFKILQNEVRRCVNTVSTGEQIRVWIPGCATGEEAYSIGMLFASELGERLGEVRVQIYATDIDTTAMALARKAKYPANAVADIPAAFLERYFFNVDEHWQVVKGIRDMVVFARHDLIKDPPFLRINLISCRNVLIYFNTAVQERVFHMFNYALVKNGALFLGRSESIHNHDKLFTPADETTKLYRPKAFIQARPYRLTQPLDVSLSGFSAEPPPADYIRCAASHYVPAGVLLNARYEILMVHGDLSRFLKVPQGKFEAGIMHLVRRRYRSELLTMLHKAKTTREPVRSRAYLLTGENNVNQRLHMAVHPVGSETPPLFLVAFETENVPAQESASITIGQEAVKSGDLEQELQLTKEQLQTVVEELETSNEELQSLNEELQATNEELRTANEQMQTTNEELQSTNEELVTVNEELQMKSTELIEANADLETIQHSIGFALVTFDTGLLVARANRPAQKLLDLGRDIPADIDDVATAMSLSSLPKIAQSALVNGEPQQFYVRKDNRDYLLRIGPWRSNIKTIIGVVMSLVDRTELAQTERDLHESQQRLQAVMDNSAAMISVKDLAGRYEYVNPAFLQSMQREAREILGKDDALLFDKETQKAIKNNDLAILRGDENFTTEDIMTLPDGKHVFLSIRFPVYGNDGALRAICTKSFDITERKRAETALQEQTALLGAILDSLSDMIAVIDRDGTLVAVNNAWRSGVGSHAFGLHEPLDVGTNYLLTAETLTQALPGAAALRDAIVDVLHNKRPLAMVNHPYDSEGERRWFQMTVTPLAAGPGGAVIAYADISEQREAEEHLRLVATVFERSSEGILILDRHGCVQKVNAAFCQLSGSSPPNLCNRHWRDLKIVALTRRTVHEILLAIRADRAWCGELWLHRSKDEEYPVWANLNTIRDQDGVSQYIVLLSDISRLKAAESSLYNLAYHDALTGLPNRAMLLERVTQALSAAERRQKCLALMFLDLDRFKIINDSLGHMVGDELLRAAALRIKECVRRSDMVARVGGDEFVVMVEDLRHAEDAAITARKIIAALGHPFEIKSHEVVVTASVGITLFPDDGTTVEELLKNADASMYIAKEKGGSRYQFFTSQMHQHSQRRLWLENHLRQAIHRGELSVHYQPQIEIGTNKWRGLEALVRWNHGKRGEVPPSEFIAVAEETRLVEEIGAWVLLTACDAFKRLRQFVPSLEVISVNVSAHQLHEPEFVTVVEQILRNTALPASCLELEITESALLVQTATAGEVIAALHDMGVRFSLDDFGTGYSSLSYLRRFPINAVKIDESFIRDIPIDNNDIAIVQSILALGKVMGLEVIAEGVENAKQLQLLEDWGCRYCQGFYTGRPVTEDNVVEATRN